MSDILPFIILAVFVVFILLALWATIRLLIKLIKRLLNELKVDTPYALMGLGISILVLPNTISKFIKGIFGFVTGIFIGAIELSRNGYPFNENSSDIAFQIISKSAASLFSSIEWEKLILFFVLWILSSLFTNQLFTESIKDDKKNRKAAIFRKNFFVVALISFALYLSIAAIVAVPVFTLPRNLDNKIITEFKEDLKKQSITENEFAEVYLDSSVFVQHIYLTTKADTVFIDQFKRQKENYLNLVRQSRRILNDKYLLAYYHFEEAFLSNVSDKIILQYRNSLLKWYLNNKENIFDALDKSKYELRTVGLSKKTTREIDLGNMTTEQMIAYFAGVAANLKKQLDQYTESAPPVRPNAGDKYGLFGFLAGWLINTEAIAFALIIGLLGFGLLGATGSTFIKEYQKKEKKELLIQDISGLMLKGVTAAFVVFLAVKGGISIFTNNSTEDVNAYAVFFACFVAAVYSDGVWEWAKNKFFGKLNEQTNKGKDKTLA